jgi:1,4-dihydroxy-2-naphthoyl-CoA hydrolase
MTDFAATMPFAVQLDIRITSATPEEVIGELDWAPDRTTLGGALHGGALMSFADSVGAVCAFLNLPEGAGTSTTSSSTVFLRGVRAGTVSATAHPLHVGRSTIAIATQLRDDDGRLVAQVTQTQAVLAGS